jgi:DNA polymerase-1
VSERFGVSAEQLPSWSALVGDASDNLPGVPGIGPRTASKLVQTFRDIPTLLDRLDEIEPSRLRDAVGAHRAQLRLNEELSRLRDDVALAAGPLASPIDAAAIDRLRGLFRDLEFGSLISRLAAIESNL